MACTTERSLDNLGPWRKRRPCLPLVGHGGNWRASHETGLRSIASAGRFLLAQGTSKTKHGSTSTTPTQPRPLVGRTIRRLRLNQPAPQEGATMKQLFRKKFTWIFTLAIAMLVVVPFAAFADNLVNDLAVAGTATFTAPGSTTIGYKINTAAAGDPQSGCNASDGSPATVT